MVLNGSAGVFAAAIALGVVHGVEPGHGWPVAASYALDKSHTWLYGLAASTILGIGHLISSIAMVGAFFFAKSYFDLAQVNEPTVLVTGMSAGGSLVPNTITVGGPVSIVAGVLLVGLGVREYRHGHSHAHGLGDDEHDHAEGHDHSHGMEHSHGNDHHHEHDDDGEHDHSHGHGYDHTGHSHDHARTEDDRQGHDHGDRRGLLERVRSALPFVGGHSHDHPSAEDAAERGLWGIAGFAFLLGFAHEEEFEIIGLCLGSTNCLSLMLVYALTVIAGIVGLTMLLIAGYERYEERVSAYADYLPLVSASVLVVMGVGFLLGLF